ncbi:MAG: TetR/AcrR family transcriptional regulator [Methylobacteriaceae bacterium]|nr:TetR/AcrR family transcriptional regulator [Methylobacteriaceae bacterium]MBV9395415.1 TetR/AcrR family transcriptional regulator [Methylobacteriaceae bacterium]
MRISKAQTKQNKERIVAAAAQLFRERGFEAVGVAELMHAAGLTHGGFYNHFESKRQLEEEACALSFGEALGPLSRIAELDSGRERRAAFASYVENYLKSREPGAAAPRCPFVVFGSDMPRQDERTRGVFGKGLRDYLEKFAVALRRKSKKPDETRGDAVFAMAAMVGAAALAYGVDQIDKDLAQEIRAVVRERVIDEFAN